MSQHHDWNRSSTSSAEMPAPVAFVIFVGIVWAVVGFFIPSVADLGGEILGFVFSSVLDVAAGAWHGIWLGANAVSILSTFDVAFPLAWSTVAGVCAGLVVAWTYVALDVREDRYGPVIKALFSAEPISKASLALLWLAVADIIAGYVVILAFGAIGLIATSGGGASPHLHEAAALIMGGGSGGGFGGSGDFLFSTFLLVLLALIMVGVVVGAVAGALIGSLSGTGFWLFNVHYAVHGATEGATLRLLLGRKKAIEAGGIKGFVAHVVSGALNGLGEGMAVGALAGLIVEPLHAVFGI
jgi:hypothetical protein